MENNFEDDKAIVCAWINLSVGKRQSSTRGSEKGCKSHADAFVRETPNLLNTSVNSKIGMKSLSLFFSFLFLKTGKSRIEIFLSSRKKKKGREG